MTSTTAIKKRGAPSSSSPPLNPPPPSTMAKKSRIEADISSSLAPQTTLAKKSRVESSQSSSSLVPSTLPLAKNSRVETEPNAESLSSAGPPIQLPTVNKEDKSSKTLRDACKECLTGTFDMDSQTIPPILMGFALATLKSALNKTALNQSVEQYITEKVLATSGGISEDPLVQNALHFIMTSARSIITDDGKCHFWDYGGVFPVMQKIPILVGGSSIECELIAFENDIPAKYADTVTKCYFDALTKILYFLLKFPGFLFASLDARQEYFSMKKTLIYNSVLDNFSANSDTKKREINEEIEKLKLDISEVERCKSGSLSVMEAMKREIEVHEKKLNKVKTSFKTLMEDALDCVDSSDEGSEIFTSMNAAGMLHIELVTQQLNFSIKEAKERFEEMQKKFGLEEKTSSGYSNQIEERKAEMESIMQVNISELNASIPVQISNGIEAYLEKFEPILACVANATSMKALIVAMKEILLSKPVVMEGILSMKYSMESFLEKATTSSV